MLHGLDVLVRLQTSRKLILHDMPKGGVTCVVATVTGFHKVTPYVGVWVRCEGFALASQIAGEKTCKVHQIYSSRR